MLLLLACMDSPEKNASHQRSQQVALEIVSPESGARMPYTLTLQADLLKGEADHIEYWIEDTLLAEGKPGEAVVGRAPERGWVAVTAVAVGENGKELGSEEVELEVGVGLNAEVMAALQKYPQDGSNGYWWPEDNDVWWGTTRDLWYRGTLLSPGDAYGRCYCVGLTWELAMGVMADQLGGTDVPVNGISVAEMDEFRIDWFVRYIWGAGPVDAVTNYGIGEWITELDEIEPGDFVQFWRNDASGHNVVFLTGFQDASGDMEGFRYWSTQSTTDGIGENIEYIGRGAHDVKAGTIYAARLWQPVDWREKQTEF